MLRSAVRNSVRYSGRQAYPHQGGRVLPSKYLLFYSRTPNNWLDVGWETDFGWDSDLSAWSIPRTVTDWAGTERDMFTILGEGLFFDAAGNSLVVSGAQILAWAGINQYHVLYHPARGLAVYDPYAVTEAVLVRAYRYSRLSYTPGGVPAENLLFYAKPPFLVDAIGDSSRAISKGSGFSGAGSATWAGLLTTDVITATCGTGSVPTCVSNGTLTFHAGNDCWGIRAYRNGQLWGYLPGINVGQIQEHDASGNGNHLTGLTTTTITERLDGSGTNYANQAGFSDRENRFIIWPGSSVNVSVDGPVSGWYSLSKITATSGGGIYLSAITSESPAQSTSYTVRMRLKKFPGSIGSTDMGFNVSGWSGHKCRIISGPGTASIVLGLAHISGLSETEETVFEVCKTNFLVGGTAPIFSIYCGGINGTRIGDGLMIKETHLCRGDYPGTYYAPTYTGVVRTPISTRGGVRDIPGGVVCIGDSITSYVAGMQRMFPLSTITDKSVGGNTTALILARFQNDVINLAPAHVVLMGGVNDMQTGVPAQDAFANIVACVELAAANGIGITLGQVTPFGNASTWSADKQIQLEALNLLIDEYGAENNILVVGTYSIMGGIDPVYLSSAFDSGDGLHPNANGKWVMAYHFGEAVPSTLLSDYDVMGYAGIYTGSAKLSFTIVSGAGPSDWIVKFSESPLVRSILGINNAYFDSSGVSLGVAYADIGDNVNLFDGLLGLVMYSDDKSALEYIINHKILHSDDY